MRNWKATRPSTNCFNKFTAMPAKKPNVLWTNPSKRATVPSCPPIGARSEPSTSICNAPTAWNTKITNAADVAKTFGSLMPTLAHCPIKHSSSLSWIGVLDSHCQFALTNFFLLKRSLLSLFVVVVGFRSTFSSHFHFEIVFLIRLTLARWVGGGVCPLLMHSLMHERFYFQR